MISDETYVALIRRIEEIEAAVEGRMVTKVVYLEQPQLALPFELTPDTAVRTVNARLNLIEEADKAGRPLALIRNGNASDCPDGGCKRSSTSTDCKPILMLSPATIT